MKSADGHIGADLARPRLAMVAAVGHQLDRQTGRIDADNRLVAESRQRVLLAEGESRHRVLLAEGEAKLKGSKAEDRKLVTVHGSMGYFADSYKMEIAGVVQTTPGQEPTPKQLADLIKKCQKEGARVIAAEPQFSKLGAVNTLKQALAQAGVANAAVIELDPLETATPEELTADWYERKIRANFEAVAKVFAP